MAKLSIVAYTTPPPVYVFLASAAASGGLHTVGTGAGQTNPDGAGNLKLSAGTGAGQLDFTSGVVKANATQWLGAAIFSPSITGVPAVDLKYVLGPASAGTAG